MKRNKHLVAAFLPALCSLLIFSCGGKHGSDFFSSNYKVFAYELRGTWETNEGNDNDYSGTLVIDYDTITIRGYAPNESNELYELKNGTGQRPFKDFTKNAPLKGYSEEGKIFIRDAGVIQEGIPYTYWDEDFKEIEFLRFKFGDRQETLRKK